MTDFTPRLPLAFGDNPNYQNVNTIRDLVRQNLKILCLTAPGERLMDINFGVGIKRF